MTKPKHEPQIINLAFRAWQEAESAAKIAADRRLAAHAAYRAAAEKELSQCLERAQIWSLPPDALACFIAALPALAIQYTGSTNSIDVREVRVTVGARPHARRRDLLRSAGLVWGAEEVWIGRCDEETIRKLRREFGAGFVTVAAIDAGNLDPGTNADPGPATGIGAPQTGAGEAGTGANSAPQNALSAAGSGQADKAVVPAVGRDGTPVAGSTRAEPSAPASVGAAEPAEQAGKPTTPDLASEVSMPAPGRANSGGDAPPTSPLPAAKPVPQAAQETAPDRPVAAASERANPAPASPATDRFKPRRPGIPAPPLSHE